MNNTLYIGNLHTDTNEEDLSNILSEAGKVLQVKLITDMITGQSKGFAFANMETDQEAIKAIETLNGQNHNGKKLIITGGKSIPENL
ncbi:RNA-binding protein [Patescibacteria group bacterium]|nr:RNA-binding protein [Patescibacteria group bacterium]